LSIATTLSLTFFSGVIPLPFLCQHMLYIRTYEYHSEKT